MLENPGKRVYHCKYNYMHIFLDEQALKAHETTAVCKKDQMGQTLEAYVLEPSKRSESQKRRDRERWAQIDRERRSTVQQ